jgi:hypothetical protein
MAGMADAERLKRWVLETAQLMADKPEDVRVESNRCWREYSIAAARLPFQTLVRSSVGRPDQPRAAHNRWRNRNVHVAGLVHARKTH